MTLQIELGAAVGYVLTLLGMFGACTAYFCKLLIAGFEKRQSDRDIKDGQARIAAEARLNEKFAELSTSAAVSREEVKKRLESVESSILNQERQLLTLKAELPREYVRREDAIRNETVTQVKIDELRSKIELILERQSK